VAAYAPAVRDGRCWIVRLAIRVGPAAVHRSTVEIGKHPTGRIQVVQHKGLKNGPPPPLCERALATLMRRWSN
jgi:hypothetical protein